MVRLGTALVALLFCVLGCQAILGIEEGTPRDENGACNAVGFVCGQPPAATGTCDGTQACTACGDKCDVTCDDDDECADDTIVCPPDVDCVVSCTGSGSCRGAEIRCPSGASCDVECRGSGAPACENTRIVCADGPCSISCIDQADTCEKASLECGCNRCTVKLDSASFVVPDQVCGSSCDCGEPAL